MTLSEYWERWQRARGYGVQSPWAYRFVTEVVGERRAYYAYAEIDRQVATRRERKYRRLLHRLANAVGPARVAETPISLLTPQRLAGLAASCTADGAIVATGIDASAQARRQWQELRDSDTVGITFDLGHFAICFLDRTRHKQHYRLLF